MNNLSKYVRSGLPILLVQTFEVKRAVNSFVVDDGIDICRWNIVSGINNTGEYKEVGELFSFIETCKRTVFILENFNWLYDNNPMITQKLLNMMQGLKNNQVCLVIVSTSNKLPEQLQKVVSIISFDLPSINDFSKIIDSFAKQLNQEVNSADLATHCLGLGYEETENELALQAVTNKSITKDAVLASKKRLIAATGFMEILEPLKSINEVGGLDIIKSYFSKRMPAYKDSNSKLPRPKFILLTGVPGCGKSLISRALAAPDMLDTLLISASVSQMKGGIVGESEAKTKSFFDTIKALGSSRTIVLLDEVEKMFSNGDGDSGVSKGQLGTFLTQLQNWESNTIFIATSNSLQSLPPEFCRRADVIFFVDFPNQTEREQIITIQNAKHGANVPVELSSQLSNYTGAEIEQLIKDSFYDDIPELLSAPTIYKTRREDIDKLRSSARFYKKSSTPESKSEGQRILN